MTEAFNPNALVDTHDLLAIRPNTVAQRHDNETAAAAFVGLARSVTNRGSEEIPLGALRDDPTNQWGLSLEEMSFANSEAETYIDASGFEAEAKVLAANAFPYGPALQAEVVRNAISVLHHAAGNTILLPRRQVYREFAATRREVLIRELGVTATSQLLQDGNSQAKLSAHTQAEARLCDIRPMAELPDLSALEPATVTSILQEMIGDAGILARLLLRYAPERLTNAWPAGPAALAQSILRRNPLDLRQALVDAPDIPADYIIAIYLDSPWRLDEYIITIAGKHTTYTIQNSRSRDEQDTRITQRQLDEQLARNDVRPGLLTAAEGEIIQLTSGNEKISQHTISRVLNANLDALAFSQLLNSVAEREAERTGMPELSKTWHDNNRNPADTLLGDFYGRVSNLHVVKLPVDESILGDRGETAEQIDLNRVVRMQIMADLCSSAGKPIRRTVEVLVYPRRVRGRGQSRDIISFETRELDDREASGANAVLRLWEASAARARELVRKAAEE